MNTLKLQLCLLLLRDEHHCKRAFARQKTPKGVPPSKRWIDRTETWL
jgi:hypothetical protein